MQRVSLVNTVFNDRQTTQITESQPPKEKSMRKSRKPVSESRKARARKRKFWEGVERLGEGMSEPDKLRPNNPYKNDEEDVSEDDLYGRANDLKGRLDGMLKDGGMDQGLIKEVVAFLQTLVPEDDDTESRKMLNWIQNAGPKPSRRRLLKEQKRNAKQSVRVPKDSKAKLAWLTDMNLPQ
jgi:hypothetical protein